MSKRFAVGHIDFFNNELKIQVIEADAWQDAVVQHDKYPFLIAASSEECPAECIVPYEVVHKDNGDEHYPEMEEDEAFKQCCFDCDSMMNWIEILPE